ncbi:hypothetical protein CHUAL_001086 [Chamberlinius hualienensis]
MKALFVLLAVFISMTMAIKVAKVPLVKKSLNSPAGECSYPGQAFGDTEDCKVFYICTTDNQPQKFTCAVGLCYDQGFNQCVGDESRCGCVIPTSTTIAP